MKINRNMSAVITNRQLLRTEDKLAASMERLSSGYKINNAGDNPAGIAISSKMRAQIAGLDQAETNASDGESVLNIADGALNEVSNILQRIRELAVQAANDTNTYSDRQAMQDEIDQLTQEVDRISTDTEYNSKNLLDGSCNRRVYSNDLERLDVSDEVLVGDYSLTVTSAATQAECTFTIPASSADGTISVSGVTMDYTSTMSDNDVYQALRDTAEQAGCEVTDNGGRSYTIKSKNYGSDEIFSVEFSDELGQTVVGDQTTTAITQETSSTGVTTYRVTTMENNVSTGKNPTGKDAEITLDKTNSKFASTATYTSDGKRITITDAGGFSIDFMISDELNSEVAQNGDQKVDIEVTDIGSMTLQVGSNQYQEIDVNIPAVSSESLYLDTIDVTVVGGADKAIATIDDAISKLGDVRSAIGAYTNRLEYAQKSLAETQEDMTAAFSNLMDTDMAEEMTRYTELNVLEQASISVLSQANGIPEQVLSLLS